MFTIAIKWSSLRKEEEGFLKKKVFIGCYKIDNPDKQARAFTTGKTFYPSLIFVVRPGAHHREVSYSYQAKNLSHLANKLSHLAYKLSHLARKLTQLANNVSNKLRHNNDVTKVVTQAQRNLKIDKAIFWQGHCLIVYSVPKSDS